MRAGAEDRIIIREYLLGRLPEEESEEIETRLLTDAEFAKALDVIEDEILEDYIDGNLSQSEKQAVEEHFLRPPERKRKLWFLRLLRSHVSKESQTQRGWGLLSYVRSNWKMAGGFAALLFLTTSLGIYSVELSRNLQFEKDNLEAIRRQNTELQKDLLALQEKNKAGSSNSLEQYTDTSLLPGTTRADDTNQKVKFSPGSTGLKIHVLPIEGSTGSYKATLLLQDGSQIWFSDNLEPSNGEVIIPIPQKLPPGHYSLVLSVRNNPAQNKEHFFRVVQ